MIMVPSSLIRVSVCMALLLGIQLRVDSKTYILCIGMQNYPGRVNDTNLCAKDAKSVKWIFDKNGDSETMILLDKGATKASVISTMRQLFSKANPEDAVAIFYSGHGNHGALCVYDGNLSYQDVYSAFLESKAKRRFAFINACYSGTMRKMYDIEHLKGGNVMFLLSARSNEQSIEDLKMKNGIFPAYLIQGLKGAADKNKDHAITARELYDFVSKKVIAKTGKRQHPVAWGRFSDNMPVMIWK